MTVARLMAQAQTVLTEVLRIPAPEARIEVRMLLCRALGDVSHAWLIAHQNDAVPAAQQLVFDELLQRRLRGEPVAYILGEREFYGLNFKVSPATLIPRPDTELLVELALQRIQPHQPCRVLDLGTGSGAIALSIAHARPDVEVTAVDASPEALEVAQLNARLLNLDNVRFLRSDWFGSLPDEHFDIIVSNPPYIAAEDEHLSQGDVRFEPSSALVSGVDGLDDIRRITAQAHAHLKDNGWLLFEHGYDQAAQVRVLLQQAGFTEVFSARDLAGIERVSGGCATPE